MQRVFVLASVLQCFATEDKSWGHRTKKKATKKKEKTKTSAVSPEGTGKLVYFALWLEQLNIVCSLLDWLVNSIIQNCNLFWNAFHFKGVPNLYAGIFVCLTSFINNPSKYVRIHEISAVVLSLVEWWSGCDMWLYLRCEQFQVCLLNVPEGKSTVGAKNDFLTRLLHQLPFSPPPLVIEW